MADQSSFRAGVETRLTSLELALLAEFNLEMAAAYDEVAEDPTAPSETRRASRDSAAARRERARLFHSEARRLSTEPTGVPERSEERPAGYGRPERRRRDRRVRERRSSVSSAAWGAGQAERRVGPDRRQRERRGVQELVSGF